MVRHTVSERKHMANRVAVFGTGYLGATHAACMAELGHEVLGVDVDAGKLARLAAGEGSRSYSSAQPRNVTHAAGANATANCEEPV